MGTRFRDGIAQIMDMDWDVGGSVKSVKLLHDGAVDVVEYKKEELEMTYEDFLTNDVVETRSRTYEVFIPIPPEETKQKEHGWFWSLLVKLWHIVIGYQRPTSTYSQVTKLSVRFLSREVQRVVNERMFGIDSPRIEKDESDELSMAAICDTTRMGWTRKNYDSKLANDKAARTVNVKVLHSDQELVMLRAEIPDRVTEDGWTKLSLLEIVLFPGREVVQAGGDTNKNKNKGNVRITKSDVDLKRKVHTIDLVIVTYSPRDIFTQLKDGGTAPAELKLFDNTPGADPLGDLSIRLRHQKFKDGSVGDNIMTTIYRETSITKTEPLRYAADSAEILATPEKTSIEIGNGESQEIVWDLEQRIVFAAAANKDNVILNLDAGAGTGKTTTIAGAILENVKGSSPTHVRPPPFKSEQELKSMKKLARTQYKLALQSSKKKLPNLVFAVAVTNTAVGQLANTLLKLTCKPNRILRIINISNESEEKTPVDLPDILAQRIEDKPKIVPVVLQDYLEFPNSLKMVKAVRESCADVQELPHDQRVAYQKNLDFCTDVMFRWGRDFVLKDRRPNIICLTLSTLLNTLKKREDAMKKYISGHAVTLWVDEASQMNESAVMTLAQLLPHSRHRYVGDPVQLQPYCVTGTDFFANNTAARGLSAVLLHAVHVPRLTLRNCRRMHPNLIELPSRFFYSGTLEGAATAETRSLLTSSFRFPRISTPFAFIGVQGNDAVAPNKSRYHDNEIKVAVSLANGLAKAVDSSKIAIICFYTEQKNRVRKTVMSAGLDCAVITVDSAQGKEWEAVILLTTLAWGDTRFISEACRVNVATTRARQGLFVLGNTRSMRNSSLWNDIVAWAARQGMVLDEKAAIERFSKIIA